MKKILYIMFGYLINIELIFAASSGSGALGVFEGSNKTQKDIRNGNIHIDDIPQIIRGAIDLLLSISGTITVIFIIIGAYKILFGSLTSEKTKGKDTIIMAFTGFAISMLAWFIIKLLIDNLTYNV